MQFDEKDLWGKFDEAKGKRQVVYTSHHPEGASVDTKTYFDAYDAFVSKCASLALKFHFQFGQIHVCSGACKWFTHGDYAFCIESGNVHTCTVDKCSERKIADDGHEEVCGFTGRSYGRVYALDQDDPETRDQYSELKEKKKAKEKPIGPALPRMKPVKGRKGRKLTAKTIIKQNDPNEQFAKATNYVNSILRGGRLDLVPDGFSGRFAKFAVATFQKIRKEAQDVKRALEYDLGYHCLVLVYRMRKGFFCKDLEIFHPHEFLWKALPNMKTFNGCRLMNKPIRPANHTRCEKQFLVGMTKQNIKTLDGFRVLALELQL